MNIKNIAFIIVFMLFSVVVFRPVETYAVGNTFSINHSLKKTSAACKKQYKNEKDCASLLGNPKCEESIAWLIQELFNVVKYAGPFLVLVLSSVDFVKTIANGDDETMSKAQKKLLIRMLGVVLLFFIPNLVWFILELFGIVTNPTCGVK